MPKLSLFFVLLVVASLLIRGEAASTPKLHHKRSRNRTPLDPRRAAEIYQQAYRHYIVNCTADVNEKDEDLVSAARSHAELAVKEYNELGVNYFDHC